MGTLSKTEGYREFKSKVLGVDPTTDGSGKSTLAAGDPLQAIGGRLLLDFLCFSSAYPLR